MMEVSHQPCPYCDSSDAYSYNVEKNVYKCFSCGASGRLQQDEGTWENEEDLIDMETYVPDEYRGIKKDILEKCGVYFSRDQDGNETVHYTYPNGTKHRLLPKTIRISGTMDKFYGQDDYPDGGKTITVTEGEEDRLSVIQMMGDWPTVSVPGATPSKAFWQNAKDYLSGFQEIKLSVDPDEPGNALAEKFYRMFPGKVYRVDHNAAKDANEYLTTGKTSEYKKSWWNAQKLKPANILSSFDDFKKLYEETPDYEFFPTGIEDLDKKMLGIHKGAFTVVLAETGLGKTEFFRYLEYQCLTNTDYSIAFCHAEETKLRSILGLVSYDLGVNVTRKDLIDFGGYEELVYESMENLSRDERMNQFSIRVDEGVDEIIEQVRFLATALGVDFIFIEPIQDFVSAANTTEKENLLTDLSNKLKRLAPELNVGIVVIAHANKDGEAKYCASIVQSAAYEIRMERDVNSDDPVEANTTKIFVGRKNRTGGGSGPAGELTFDRDSYTLTPVSGPDEPTSTIGESNKAVGF